MANNTNGGYWQTFSTGMAEASSLLISQPQPPQPPQQQQQSQWSDEADKRKWNQDFSEFDINSHSKVFHMDDYNNNHNNDPSEGDSPDSGSGRRGDLLSDGNMFQGGDQKQRRKEQNRAAQRAFRERKERYVKDLQGKIKEMEKKHTDEMTRVTQENDALKALVKKMEAEIYTLKGAAMAFDVSLAKLRQSGLDAPSPPQSDRLSPPAGRSVDERRSIDRYSASVDDDLLDDEEASFAERETNRFHHQVDPMVLAGVKMVPCSQIWERLAQHPNFDEFDMDQLCEELKKKAKCSGSGPVIPESEIQEVLRQMDSSMV